MKRLKFLLVAFLLLTLTVSAQQNVDYSKPVLVDAFGLLQISDIKARLDAAVVAFQDAPKTKIVIIGYRGKGEIIGKTLRNFRMMKAYLSQSRGVDPDRLIMINGGENSSGFRFQIWITPEGQMPEIIKPENNYLDDTGSARQFDNYYYAFTDLEYEYWDGDSLKEFTDIIKKEPDSIAYVILYPEYNSYDLDANEKTVVKRDSLHKINGAKASLIKDLTKKYKLPLSKIKIVNGGYRDFRQVELWILPKGVAAPAATPNAFPKTQKRSGKR